MKTCFIFSWFEQTMSLEGAFTHIHMCCQGQKGLKLVLRAACNESQVHNTGILSLDYVFLKFYFWFMEANELGEKPGSDFHTVEQVLEFSSSW